MHHPATDLHVIQSCQTQETLQSNEATYKSCRQPVLGLWWCTHAHVYKWRDCFTHARSSSCNEEGTAVSDCSVGALHNVHKQDPKHTNTRPCCSAHICTQIVLASSPAFLQPVAHIFTGSTSSHAPRHRQAGSPALARSHTCKHDTA